MYARTTVTSNLKWHIRALHHDLWNANAEKNGWKNLDSQVSTKSIELCDGPREEFNVENFHQWLVNFIIVDDQVSPFCTLNGVSVSHCFIPRQLI